MSWADVGTKKEIGNAEKAVATSRQCRHSAAIMKTVEQLKTAWESLPDSASFRHHFAWALSEVVSCDEEIAERRKALEMLESERKAALERLNHRVSAAARAEWAECDVKEVGL